MAGRFSVEAVFKAVDKLTAPVRRMSLGTKKFTKAMRRDFIRAQRQADLFIGRLKSNIGPAIRRMALVGFAGLTLAVGGFIREASKIEDAIAAFQPILGSVENAKKAVDDLNATAATTPFQFEQLANSSKTLLGFGVATQNTLVPMLRMLGDTAGGSADRLNGITLAFSQIQAAGKANMQDINQLINNGIPILGELAEMWGVTVGEARSMISTSRATGSEVTKAFKKMTSEGGRFFKGMEIASKTFSGKMSTLKDNIALTAAGIGGVLLPTIKEYVDSAIEGAGGIRLWVEQNKELIKVNLKGFLDNIITALKIIGKLLSITFSILGFLKPFIPIILGVATAFWAYHKALLAVAIAQRAVAFAKGITATQKWVIVLGILIGVIFEIVKRWDSFGSTTKTLIKVLAVIAGVIATVILVVKAWKVAQIALNIALSANPIGIVIILLGLLAFAIYKVVNQWDLLQAQSTFAIDTFKLKLAELKLSLLDTFSIFDVFSDKFKDFRAKAQLEVTQRKRTQFKSFVKSQLEEEKLKQADKKQQAQDSFLQSVISGGQANVNTNELVIRNQSKNDVDSKGRTIGTGSSLRLNPSG